MSTVGEVEVSPVQRAVEDDVLRRVLASFDETPDPRLREIMESLVRHLHGVVCEVRLSEEEWTAAIGFLTATGHITDHRRQELVLLSDVLGASMQTIAVNNPVSGDATEATVLGPFFVDGSPAIDLGGDIAGGAPGEPCWVEGSVRSVTGEPVPGARLEVWQADEAGLHDVQHDEGVVAGRGHLVAADDGGFSFWGLTPTPHPIPDDGPVGDLLKATRRSPYRAPHLHFMVDAPGYHRLVTHIFVAGGQHLDDDSVFGVKDSLIKQFVPQTAGTPAPDGRDLGDRPWSRVRFDIVLAPASA